MTVRNIHEARQNRNNWPYVTYSDEHGNCQEIALDEAREVAFERAGLARQLRSHKGQLHTPGYYWAATTRSLVPYESHLESQWLTMLDFDVRTVAFAAQPMRLVGPVEDGWLDHVPDFFVREVDGSARLIDVTHPRRVHTSRVQEQVEQTRRCAEAIGWRYEQLTAPESQVWLNVSWLAGFRREPAYGIEHCDRLIDLAAKPVALVDLISFIDEPLLARPIVFHLCWQQALRFDLTEPLRDTTLLEAAEVST